MEQGLAGRDLIGLFMINPEGEVCFAQVGDHQRLTEIRIVPGPCAVAVLADGTEEMFTSEIHAEILAPMKATNQILVAHLDDDGKAIDEYTIPLTVRI